MKTSLLSVFAFAVLMLPRPAALAGSRPNVLLICVDDLRTELGCYGHRDIHTPNLDKLAARGVRFNRAYVQVSQCGPSRVNLLTGLRPDTTKMYTLETGRFRRANHPGVTTLGEHFKRNGYHTQALGKVFHNGRDDPASWSVPTWENDGRNFMFLYVDEPKLAAMRASRGGEIPPREVPTRHGSKLTVIQSPDVDDRVLGDGIVADRAIATLQKLRDRPFLLAVGFYRPHLPFVAPKRYFDLYPLQSVRLPAPMSPPKGAPVWGWFNAVRYFQAGWRAQFPTTSARIFAGGPPVTPSDPQRAIKCAWAELRSYNAALQGASDELPGFGPVAPETLRRFRRAYLASTSYVDAQIGRVLDELERLGLRDRTIVVLWSDHGWHLGENGVWGKLTNYEWATRNPLIVADPRHPAAPCDALVETVDVFPTLVELCDLPPAQHVEGTSMAPLLKDPGQVWKKAAFSQYPRGDEVMGRAVRTDRYRYVEWQRTNGEVAARELYDHQTDPGETVNLAAQEGRAATVERLEQTLAAGWKAAMPREPESKHP